MLSVLYASNLEHTGSKRWRVRARNTTGHSDWSVRADFIVDAVAPPIPVSGLLAPLGAGWDGNPVFQWESVPSANEYRLYIADANSGESEFLSEWISAQKLGCMNSKVCTYIGNLDLSGEKKWRVKAFNQSGQSAWSLRGDFTAAIPPVGVPGLVSPVGDQEAPLQSWFGGR